MRASVSAVPLALVIVACASGGSSGVASPTATPTTRIGTTSGATVGTVATATGNERIAVDVPVSAQRAWEVLPLVYAELEIPIRLQQQASRLIGNTGFETRRVIGGQRASRYLNCGNASGGPNADTFRLTISVVTQVHEGGDGNARLETRLTANAASVTYAGTVVTCSTTGALERHIAERVQELASQGR